MNPTPPSRPAPITVSDGTTTTLPPPIPGTQVPYGDTTDGRGPDLPRAADRQEWYRSPATFGMIALILLTAVAADLAVQSTLASVAAVLAAAGCAGVISMVVPKLSQNQYFALGIVGLLATNLVLRTSVWVIGPTILAIAAFLMIAAQEHLLTSRPFVMTMVGIRWFENLFFALPWMATPIAEASKHDSVRLRAVVRGFVTAGAIAVLLGLLLAAADSVFAALFSNLAAAPMWTHFVLVAFLVIPVAALGASASSDKPLAELDFCAGRFGIEGFMGLVTITGVLGLWCATQLFVALGRADEFLAREGLTRAEYARKGFFQLVIVAVVVVGLLNLLDRVTERTNARQNRIFTGLGVLATMETIVLIAITYGRLDYYMNAFGLTMLRLSVACFLGWLAVVMVLVAARLGGLGSEKGWTAAASLVLAALTTVGFGWSNPEAFVTSSNLAASGPAELDTRYLAELSADAQPTIIASIPNLPADEARSLTSNLCLTEIAEPKYSVLSWNWSNYQATNARIQLDC